MNLFTEILKSFIGLIFFAGNILRFVKDIDRRSGFVVLDVMGAFIACFLITI